MTMFVDAMNNTTVRMKTCSSCSNKIISDTVYCRWCGTKQVVALKKYLAAVETKNLDNSKRSYVTSVFDTGELPPVSTGKLESATKGLTGFEKVDLYHRVSGDLVRSVLKAFPLDEKQNVDSLQGRAYRLLMTLSVYLILILSAPIDAFVATKNLMKKKKLINGYQIQSVDS